MKKSTKPKRVTTGPESVIQPAGFYACRRLDRLMVGTPEHMGDMRQAIDKLVRDAGLTLFGSSVERYSDEEHHGYTYLAWIGESAIDIHSWPEYNSAIVNSHVCNLEKKNEKKLAKFFRGVKAFYGARQVRVATPVRLSLLQ